MDKELLYRFFSCSTSPEEEQPISDWLSADPKNMELMIAEREKYNGIILHTPDSTEIRSTRRMPLVNNFMRYAAVIVLALVLSGVIGTMMNRSTVNKLAGLTTTISAPAGQRVNLTLQDGSAVWLNSGATIEYPVVFAKNNRKVKLEGEAFFEVEHDASRPFVVETFGYDIEVLGTKFSVDAECDKGCFSTLLTEGSVRITNTTDRGETITLTPNQMVKLTDGYLAVTDNASHDALLWRDGLISLQDATFTELMDRFEKCYGVDIIIERDEIPFIRSRGKIRISEGIDHAMRILQRGCDFTYTKEEETNRIYIR